MSLDMVCGIPINIDRTKDPDGSAEIINEPFIAARSTLHLPLATLTRSNTETSYLQPMYDRVETAIRQYDDRALIFYEPVCGSGGYLGDGFSKTPGNRPEKAVFSFHSYGPNPVDRYTMEGAVNKGIAQAKRLGGASMVGTDSDLVKCHADSDIVD